MNIFKTCLGVSLFSLFGCAEKGHQSPTIDKLAQTSDISNPTAFQYPIFDGFTEICLPYMEVPEDDESAAITNLAYQAGFQLGDFGGVVHENPPRFRYSTGDKVNGAEIWAYSNLRGRGRSCEANFRDISEYPSLKDFTDWLNDRNSDWYFVSDESHSVVNQTANVTHVIGLFCKNEGTEKEQSLVYHVIDFEAEHRRKKNISISVRALNEYKKCFEQAK